MFRIYSYNLYYDTIQQLLHTYTYLHHNRMYFIVHMYTGKSHTPEAFVKACESFTFSEILSPPLPKRVKQVQTKGEGGGGGKDKPVTVAGKDKPVTMTGKDKPVRPKKNLITLNSTISFIDTLMNSLEEKANSSSINTNNTKDTKKHKPNASNSILHNTNNNNNNNTTTTKKKSNAKSSKKLPETLNSIQSPASLTLVPLPVPPIPVPIIPPVEIVNNTIDLNQIDRAFKMAVDIGKLLLHALPSHICIIAYML